jgi:hypothetical protein
MICRARIRLRRTSVRIWSPLLRAGYLLAFFLSCLLFTFYTL